MTKELEHLFNSALELKQHLSSVLPPEAVTHIMRLIAKEESRQKYLKLDLNIENIDN